jgi:hypothetical protein
MTTSLHGVVVKFRFLFVISLTVLLTACAANTKNKSSINTLYQGQSDLQILLMPLDVELSVLTASGLEEPRADWTETAKQHMQTALRDYQAHRGAELIHLKEIEGADMAEIQRLHNAVGVSILYHEFIPMLQLPTKVDNFDWTLGPEVATLKQDHDADYALFIHVRDSYSSGGRIAATIVAAMFGVGLANGQQVGFASLVDLNTGKVSWFNRLFSTTGDLRTAESAVNTVNLLLDGLPQ